MDMMLITSLLGIALLSSGVSFKIAEGKGHNRYVWAFVGLVVPLLAPMVVTMLPPKLVKTRVV